MRITLSNARPGMVIGKEIRNIHGQVLLGAGAVLSERSLRVLQTWGIRSIDTDESSATGSSCPTIDRSMVEQAAVIERRRFSQCNVGDDLMNALFRIAVRRRALAIAHEQRRKGSP